MKVHITKIARFTTKKDGTALMTKDGRPYTSVRIQCTEYGDKWVSGFQNQETAIWKEGDEAEVEIEQKGEYLNFKTPKKEDKANEKLEQILNGQVGIKMALASIDAKLDRLLRSASDSISTQVEYPEDMNPDDVPF